MKRITVFITILFYVQSLYGQNSFKAVVKDKVTLEVLQGVTVSAGNNTKATVVSNASGMAVINDLTTGNTTIRFSYVGYKAQEVTVTIPDTIMHTVLMDKEESALESVTVVASTRSNDAVTTQ